MFKFKQFGVAAGVMLLATASAFANNFRAADQVYLLAAGHLTAGSSTFISDVFISNLSSDSVDVSVIYTPTGDNTTQQNFNKVLTLQPNERREIIDFFPSALGLQSAFGDLVFNACKATADCTPDANGENTNYRNISVESRIFSIPNGTTLSQGPPTVGQLFAGIPWYMYASSANAGFSTVFVTGLRNTGGNGTNGTFRGNIGLVNASQFSTTTLRVSLFNGLGQQIGTTQPVFLGVLGHKQINIGTLFPTFTGATATGAYVTISQAAGDVTKVSSTDPTKDADANHCENGCPSFMAYGSVLDNSLQSGDPTTLEPQFLQGLNAVQVNCMFQVNPSSTQCKTGQTVRRAVRH